MQIKTFTFNFFGVNTYVLYDETGSCTIIDPACNEQKEEDTLFRFIEDQKLTPLHFINTHCHVDHVAGNFAVQQRYQIPLITHPLSIHLMEAAKPYASVFGFKLEEVIMPDRFVNHGAEISFGSSLLKVLYTPGHAEGSICLYSQEDNFVITGDVLFEGSIGRTDLPSGDYDVLMASIHQQLMVLPESCKVFPGHGNATTIGMEKINNPFL